MKRYLFLIVVFAATLTGCTSLVSDGTTSAAAGGASYHYRKNADGSLDITVTSSRDVSGVSVAVDGTDGSLTVDVDQLDVVPMSADYLKTLLNP